MAGPVLLVAEQGLGDTLQFIRFAPLVKQRASRVELACPRPLMRLVARCPGVDRVVDWKGALPECDVHVPLLSLPAILGLTLETIPESGYLSVDKGTVDQWRPNINRAMRSGLAHDGNANAPTDRVFKIGIAWQGNRGNTVDRSRSFPLAHFSHLADLPGVRLISLQKGDGTEQLDGAGGAISRCRALRSKRRRRRPARLSRYCRGDETSRPGGHARFGGGPSGGRTGCLGMDAITVHRGMAMADRTRRQPVVSHDAAVPANRFR